MIRAVTALQYIADRKIEEAIVRGEFDNLPGAGRPIDLDDCDPLMPPEARMAWRILKNANLNPGDLLLREKDERRRAFQALLASS
jgi:hypothetical protein